MGIAEKEAVLSEIFDGLLKTQYTKDSVLREELTRSIARKLTLVEIGQLHSLVALRQK
jgi:hypothetical protein